jgi:hypothetical protein
MPNAALHLHFLAEFRHNQHHAHHGMICSKKVIIMEKDYQFEISIQVQEYIRELLLLLLLWSLLGGPR